MAKPVPPRTGCQNAAAFQSFQFLVLSSEFSSVDMRQRAGICQHVGSRAMRIHPNCAETPRARALLSALA
jgi:hypothetical protein